MKFTVWIFAIREPAFVLIYLIIQSENYIYMNAHMMEIL